MKTSVFNRLHPTPHLALYIGIFVIFLTTGVWSGRFIGSSGPFLSSPSQRTESPKSVQAPTIDPVTEQRNLLVIGVDKLQAAKPELESAWLVMYFPGKPNFTLLPVYPTPGEHGIQDSPTLLTSFSLDTTGTPNPAFLHQLADWVWWNNYLVIDQSGMIALIDMLGGLSIDNLNLDGTQVMARMPSSSQDSDTAYASQVSLLANLCGQTRKPPSRKAIISTLRSIKNNLTTDLDLIIALDTWLSPNRKLLAVRCEFPLSTPSIP